MTNDAIQIVQWILTNIWRFFTGFYFPGTNVTPAMVIFLVLFLKFVLRVIPALLSTSTMVFGRADTINNDIHNIKDRYNKR